MEAKKWYELHLTAVIETETKDLFSRACEDFGVKPIVIDLETGDGTVLQRDVMTSSKLHGTLAEAQQQAQVIGAYLASCGFSVIRIKIESEPSHPMAPQEIGDIMPEQSYFESHMGFLCDEQQEEWLRAIATEAGANISRNPFKKTEQGKVIMLTLRDHVSPFVIFRGKVDNALAIAERYGMRPHKKIEVEFAVYDSNWEHDHHWVQ